MTITPVGDGTDGAPESVATVVAELRDRARIEALLYEYCKHVDAVDVPAIMDLFTDDAIFDIGHGRVYERQDMDHLFQAMVRYSATSHHVSNVMTSFEGPDRALVESTLYAFHRVAESGQEVHLWGRYFDEVVVREGRWLLRSRALRAAAERGSSPARATATRYEPIDRVGR